MKIVGKILQIVCAVALSCYVIVVLVAFSDPTQQLTCDNTAINIYDSATRRFITATDITDCLRRSDLVPDGRVLAQVNSHQIEDCLKQLQTVDKVDCYKGGKGTVYINIHQRVPCLRVMSTENYYVDKNRETMRATFRTAAFVPVITGYVTEQMATNELYDFVSWLEQDNFWKGEIEQINVTARKQIELIQRRGNHVILLGTLDDGYKNRMRKLQKYYVNGTRKFGWQPCKELDIRFKNQVICRN